MDMTEIDDKLLEQFFQPARAQQVEDRGFTQRVMKRLPDKALRLSSVWTTFCVVVGIALFVAVKGWQPLLMGLSSLIQNMTENIHPLTFFVTMGVLSCLALLELIHRFERMQV